MQQTSTDHLVIAQQQQRQSATNQRLLPATAPLNNNNNSSSSSSRGHLGAAGVPSAMNATVLTASGDNYATLEANSNEWYNNENACSFGQHSVPPGSSAARHDQRTRQSGHWQQVAGNATNGAPITPDGPPAPPPPKPPFGRGGGPTGRTNGFYGHDDQMANPTKHSLAQSLHQDYYTNQSRELMRGQMSLRASEAAANILMQPPKRPQTPAMLPQQQQQQQQQQQALATRTAAASQQQQQQQIIVLANDTHSHTSSR